jgi:hypothetical protein
MNTPGATRPSKPDISSHIHLLLLINWRPIEPSRNLRESMAAVSMKPTRYNDMSGTRFA